MQWLKKIAVTLAVIYLVVWGALWVASPPLTRMIVGDLLAPYQLKLDDNSSVRFNLLLSCVTVENLKWHKSESEAFYLSELEACYSLHRLLFREAELTHLTLTGLRTELSLNDDEAVVAGFALPQATDSKTESSNSEPQEATKPFPLIFSAPDIHFQDIQLHLVHQGQPHLLTLNQLHIRRSRLENNRLTSEFQLELDLNQAQLQLDGVLDVEPETSELNLELDLTEFDPQNYLYLLPESIEAVTAKLDVQSQLTIAVAGKELSLASSDTSLQLEELSYADQSVMLNLDAYQIAIRDIEFEQSDSVPIQLSASFDAQLSQLEINASDGRGQLLTLQQLNMQPAQLSLQGERLRVQLPETEIIGITALTRHLGEGEQLPPLAAIESIRLSQLEIGENSAALASLQVGAIKAEVLRGKNGEIVSLVLPKPVEAETEPAAAVEAEQVVGNEHEQALFAIRLDQFQLVKPAKMKFQDLSLQPELAKELTVEQLTVTGVDSEKPEQEAEFAVELKDEAYFNYQLAGKVKPFSPKINLSFSSKGSEFPLHEISPYIRDALGFDIRSGLLDLTAKGKVVDDHLDTKTKLFLRGANFDSGTGDANKENSSIIGQAAIPLDVALGMLKDGDGNIELTIPVTGDVKDPSFGMHYIFGLIAKKAVMSQAQDYLITTFLPYAQVIKVGMAAGSYALKVRFDDLVYEPGQVEPAAEQATFMKQFKALMQDKPDLQVNVCGIATAGDLALPAGQSPSEEQQKALLDVATKRAAGFKKQMVEQGVQSSRLLLCVPTFELKSKAKPRLSLSV